MAKINVEYTIPTHYTFILGHGVDIYPVGFLPVCYNSTFITRKNLPIPPLPQTNKKPTIRWD